jgi:hypothetical protein
MGCDEKETKLAMAATACGGFDSEPPEDSTESWEAFEAAHKVKNEAPVTTTTGYNREPFTPARA